MPDDQEYVSRLIAHIARAEPGMLAASETHAAQRPAPGKWSAKEMVGHLIDSATNNHQRFVRAATQDSLVFETYEQDRWVAAQRYNDAPWSELVRLWAAYNRHVARVMAATPVEVRTRAHTRHNLHQIAWREVPADTPTTLDYLMCDYVDHLAHHLRQITDLLPSVAR